jgi:predicted 3-demethylubiquinone-9 3-methyltransferase (glyoxalase superfamily)
MQKITPFLWFDNNAEEAMQYYISVFKDAKIGNVSHYPDGRVLTCDFELFGQKFIALNGGPMFKFTEAVSFFVTCETQEEVDMYWNKLTSDGGEESMCGWLKDKFGLSWQIIPKALGSYLQNPDKQKAARAMQAMMKMKKIVIADLEKAANG